MTPTGTPPTDRALGADPATVPPFVWTDFEEFYRSEHRQLERALMLATGDVELGRDATAEGFARALQRWNKVARYDNPTGWVYRVALNWAHSRRRRVRRDASKDAAGVVRHRRPDTETPPVLSGEVTAALLRLNVEQRTVVVARFVFDWSEAEVAAALDIAPGTAKSRSSRAIARLAQLLEEHHD